MNNTIYTIFAATQKIDPGTIGVNKVNANTVVPGILTAVYTWAGIICVIVMIVAGYLYVTANANASRIKRAKDAILYASVGIVIIASAFVITQYVIGRF